MRRRWAGAALRAARPRQWPKNLLVLAAPLAGASLGRDDGIGYALVAIVAFIAASSAVYYVNDVVDAERDRGHPVKRNRPVASGDLPAGHALAARRGRRRCGARRGTVDRRARPDRRSRRLPGPVVPVLGCGSSTCRCVELGCVASGFVLRALAGAAATHVPPSGWFLLVCSLGALIVAITKRRTELAVARPGSGGQAPAGAEVLPGPRPGAAWRC